MKAAASPLHKHVSLEEVCKEHNLDPKNIPQHVAVIMDGNGRWAKKRLLPRIMGHKTGTEALRRTIKACTHLKIKYLTVYAFSTENWKRPEKEVSFLMKLIKDLTLKEIPELKKEGAKIKALGALSELHPSVQESLKEAEEETKDNDTIQVNLMINYGARRELKDAIETIIEKKENNPELEITEDLISEHLYTKSIPDPEILIRTGGDYRISNYMLWQLSYSELFFIDTLWPDFNIDALAQVIRQFQKRERRFGGLNT